MLTMANELVEGRDGRVVDRVERCKKERTLQKVAMLGENQLR